MILKNSRIITPNEVLKDHILLIEKGKIKKIDKKENINHYKRNLIDCQDKYLSPGFIDIHNHGNSGFDFMNINEKSVDEIAGFHLKNGVTSFLGTITTGPLNKMLEATKFLSNYRNKKNKSQLLGIHLEGPFFNIRKKGAQNGNFFKKPCTDILDKFLKIPGEKIKMLSLAPELDNSQKIISSLLKNNKIIGIGHSLADYDESKKAFNMGASVVTHLYNGMGPFNHRSPGLVGASLTDDRVYAEIIYDRIHLHDAAVELAIRSKGADRIILVSDAISAAGMNDGVYKFAGQNVYVKKGVARLKNGDLAGSTLNLHQALKNILKYQSIDLNDAIKMVSLNPARALGLEDEVGSIEEGKKADLLILDHSLNLDQVILEGFLV